VVNTGGYAAYGFKDKGFKWGYDLSVRLIKRPDLKIKALWMSDVKESAQPIIQGVRQASYVERIRNAFVNRMDFLNKGEVSVSFRTPGYLRFVVFGNNTKVQAKYTYGLLEKQFRKTFDEAARRKGVTGENLIKLLEARLDNTVFRMGIAPSRQAARQLVSHKHITVNGEVVNVPSYSMKPGETVGLKNKSAVNTSITGNVRGKNAKFSWIDFNETELKGTFLAYPERENVPENIKEQLIVELYSK
jgi:small subunit ribosomal protein S4